jgi:hypothetical protein
MNDTQYLATTPLEVSKFTLARVGVGAGVFVLPLDSNEGAGVLLSIVGALVVGGDETGAAVGDFSVAEVGGLVSAVVGLTVDGAAVGISSVVEVAGAGDVVSSAVSDGDTVGSDVSLATVGSWLDDDTVGDTAGIVPPPLVLLQHPK